MKATFLLLMVDLLILTSCSQPVIKSNPAITTGISGDLSAADAKAVLIQQWANHWRDQVGEAHQ